MSGWFMFGMGMIVGGSLGFFLAGLLRMAAIEDRRENRDYIDMQEYMRRNQRK